MSAKGANIEGLAYNSRPNAPILSHTWEVEVTFKDLMEDTGKNKAGYNETEFWIYRRSSIEVLTMSYNIGVGRHVLHRDIALWLVGAGRASFDRRRSNTIFRW